VNQQRSHRYLVEMFSIEKIRQILEKRWEYNETVHQLFIDFKKVYDSVRREVLYNILIVWNPHEIGQAH
jgi:hypothetical protein